MKKIIAAGVLSIAALTAPSSSSENYCDVLQFVVKKIYSCIDIGYSTEDTMYCNAYSLKAASDLLNRYPESNFSLQDFVDICNKGCSVAVMAAMADRPDVVREIKNTIYEELRKKAPECYIPYTP